MNRNKQEDNEDNRESRGFVRLAPVQRKTLEYLRSYISEHGYAPTLKDIAQAIGVRSVSTAHFHLSRLASKGFLERNEEGSFGLCDTPELEPQLSSCAVPLAGVIAAGRPIEAVEDSSVTVELPMQFVESPGEVFCLQVSGDSMIGAHIVDGDVIIVRRQDNAHDGEIVVALLEDGTSTLKTLRRMKGGKVMLLPHNPRHQPITADNVTIQGRVVGLIREM